MATFDDVREAIKSSQAICYLRGGEVQVRCPECGDSRHDPRSAHLYISEAWPHPWNCFRGGFSGRCLTVKLLEMLDSATREASVYARQVEKEFKRRGYGTRGKLYGSRQGERMVIPPPDRSDEIDAANLGYLEDRLGLQFEDWELQRYKVVLGLERFLRANGIENHTLGDKPWSQKEFERLDARCVGFLSSDESYAIMRSTEPGWGSEKGQRRYTNYKVWPDREGSKHFTTRQDLDPLAPAYEVVIAEGVTGLIQAERLFHADRRKSRDFLGAACCGCSFAEPLKKLVQLGLFPMKVHLYMDYEPDGVGDSMLKMLSRTFETGSPFFNTPGFDLTVYRNGVEGQKDFGVSADKIKRIRVRLSSGHARR